MCWYIYQILNIKYFQYISILKQHKNIVLPFTTSLFDATILDTIIIHIYRIFN